MKHWLFLFMTCAFLLPLPVLAEQVVFLTDDYPPYDYLQDGKVVGIGADLVRMVCAELDITPDIRMQTWQTAMRSVTEGHADAIFYLYKTPQREKILFFPDEPLALPKSVIWSRKDNATRITALSDLKNRVVGLIDGYTYSPEFDSNTEIIKKPFKDVRALVNQLHSGRIEFAAAAEMPFLYLSKQEKLGDTFQVAMVITHSPVYVAFSKAKGEKGAVLAEKFANVLRSLRQQGVTEQLTKRYME